MLKRLVVGAIVRLQSGGPAMTILRISPSGMDSTYDVGYFDRDGFKRIDGLHSNTLKVLPDAEEPLS